MIVFEVILAFLVFAFVYAWRVDRRAKRNGDRTRSAAEMTRDAYGSRTGGAAANSVRSPDHGQGGLGGSGGMPL